MNKRDTTSAVIDNVLNLAITGTALASALVIPNLLVALERPLEKYWKHLDKRARERELRRVVTYMKSRDFIRGDYEHGLRISRKGRARLDKSRITSLKIPTPKKWDGRWRLIIFDIPEQKKPARNSLNMMLNKLRFYRLQRSVWVHPHPCRDELIKITSYYGVESFVSYIETDHIDNDKKLRLKFKTII